MRTNIAISLSVLFLLFCFELPLLGVLSKTHVVNVYKEPSQTVEGSGIYIISVASIYVDNMRSNQEAREYVRKNHDEEIITINKLTNSIIYENKNRQILKLFHLQKPPKEKMRENLKLYFGKEEKRLADYFEHDKAVGDSSGLSLLLTELIIKGELQNNIRLAITGAIDSEGNVSAIGGLREKLLIAEKYGFHFLIIPSKQAKEAEALQRELKLNIEIFDVDHVKEAIEVIGGLNKKYEQTNKSG